MRVSFLNTGFRKRHSFYTLRTCASGFTLVELIIGITLVGVALITLVSFVSPLNRQGVDPLWQVRATTLAQSLLNEISSKAFDENSITANGRAACNNIVSCTRADSLGIDSLESRRNFDDIDDFNNLVLSGADIINSPELTLSQDVVDLFLGFRAQVTVFYDDNEDGINDADPNNDGVLENGAYVGNQKLIRVIVFTPDDQALTFSTYRTNF